MVHRLVSCRVYPVVTEDTTVWKYHAIVADDGRSDALAVGPDESFPTQRDAMAAAAAAVRKLDRIAPGSRKDVRL